ncbi:uncharacterized protein VTP21DRAFT_4134 [Calcarisporiella thermophila]|uniref:uncharacterized protein n=1 Tax=Calcarisporiella thermophila TaxID=911321 RepID=UPI0037424508
MRAGQCGPPKPHPLHGNNNPKPGIGFASRSRLLGAPSCAMTRLIRPSQWAAPGLSRVCPALEKRATLSRTAAGRDWSAAGQWLARFISFFTYCRLSWALLSGDGAYHWCQAILWK